MKKLSLNQNAYRASLQYPELIEIIAKLGFSQVRNPFLRKTFGSKYTLNQLISVSKINRKNLIESLKNNGFEII